MGFGNYQPSSKCKLFSVLNYLKQVYFKIIIKEMNPNRNFLNIITKKIS